MFQIELPIIGGRSLKAGPTSATCHLASFLFPKEAGKERMEGNKGGSQGPQLIESIRESY